MSKIAKELAKQAKANGICDEWYGELITENDTEKMLDMYIKGIDFCMENDYPTNDYIRKTFKGKMEHRGIHLDDNSSMKNSRFAVLLGTAKADMQVDEYNISEVFLKDESEMILEAKGNSFVMVDMFQNSRISLIVNDNAKVCINHYGGEIMYNERGCGMVKIREKSIK